MEREQRPIQPEFDLAAYNPYKSFVPKVKRALSVIDRKNEENRKAGRPEHRDPLVFVQRVLRLNDEALSKNVISLLDALCPDGGVDMTATEHRVYKFLDIVATSDVELKDASLIDLRKRYLESRKNFGYLSVYNTLLPKAQQIITFHEKRPAKGEGEDVSENKSHVIEGGQAQDAWMQLRGVLQKEAELAEKVSRIKSKVFGAYPEDLDKADFVPELHIDEVTKAARNTYAGEDEERVARVEQLRSLTDELCEVPVGISVKVLETILTSAERERIKELRTNYHNNLSRAREVVSFGTYKDPKFRLLVEQNLGPDNLFSQQFLVDATGDVNKAADIIAGISSSQLSLKTLNELKRDRPQDGKSTVSRLRDYMTSVAYELIIKPDNPQADNK